MKKLALLATALCMVACKSIEAPKSVGAIPSARQLPWHEMEYYAFIHFNMNTFTDMEWGTGGEDPVLFNPTELDVNQWVKVIKDAGMKGVIITAKHHDGFCLWPSKYTEHSVKNSPWKNGKGDVIKELSEACHKAGLKFGVYLSPWDRNHAEYGREAYVTYFHNQLRELLTNYGEIFEVWFDGANGGSGYYGGANETRTIDAHTYYQWDKTFAIVRELQPNATIFGDEGPDIRWIGNEKGFGTPTNWNPFTSNPSLQGKDRLHHLGEGDENGVNWIPAEADVSIRPGWYYHAREDHQVRPLEKMVDIYYASVGRGYNLLLNLPGLKPVSIGINKTGKQSRDFPRMVEAGFKSDNHILMFPAGLNSRKINGKIHDLEWKKTFIAKSVEYQRDVVPIFFGGRNSDRFYRIARFSDKYVKKVNIAMLFLVDEMYRNVGKTFRVVIGKPIPWQTFDKSRTSMEWAQYVEDMVYEL